MFEKELKISKEFAERLCSKADELIKENNPAKILILAGLYLVIKDLMEEGPTKLNDVERIKEISKMLDVITNENSTSLIESLTKIIEKL